VIRPGAGKVAIMEGRPGIADLLGMSRAGRRIGRQSVAAILRAVAGYFTCRALPPPPGLPTVRAFQAAQGEVARQLLAGCR
jgi:hypothetical protein